MLVFPTTKVRRLHLKKLEYYCCHKNKNQREIGKIHNVEKEMSVTKQMFENNFDLAKKSFYSSRRLQSSSYLLIIVKIQLNVSVNGKWAQGNLPLPSKWTHLIEQENVEMTFKKILLLGKDLRCDLNLLCLLLFLTLLRILWWAISGFILSNYRFLVSIIHEKTAKASYLFSSRNDWQGKKLT